MLTEDAIERRRAYDRERMRKRRALEKLNAPVKPKQTEAQRKAYMQEYMKGYQQKNGEKLRAYKAEWREKNREHDRAKKREWYLENREEMMARARERHKLPEVEERRMRTFLKVHYGDIAKDVRPRPENCEICGRKSRSGRKLCFEHCHKTGMFRGWTCSECNIAIERADDDPEILRAIADYLENFYKDKTSLLK